MSSAPFHGVEVPRWLNDEQRVCVLQLVAKVDKVLRAYGSESLVWEARLGLEEPVLVLHAPADCYPEISRAFCDMSEAMEAERP